MSQLTQCQVYGINIDETQLKDARQCASKHKTNNQFLFKDLNKPLPFQDNEFDAIYEFGAFTSFTLISFLSPGGSLFSSRVLKLSEVPGPWARILSDKALHGSITLLIFTIGSGTS